MTDTITKILRIGLVLVLIISLLLFALFYINGESMTGTVLTWAYLLFIITVGLLIGFPILHIVKNPKSGMRALLIIVGFAALYGISYAFASSTTSADYYEKANITPAISKLIGGALIMTYILFGLAAISLIVSSLGKLFK